MHGVKEYTILLGATVLLCADAIAVLPSMAFFPALYIIAFHYQCKCQHNEKDNVLVLLQK